MNIIEVGLFMSKDVKSKWKGKLYGIKRNIGRALLLLSPIRNISSYELIYINIKNIENKISFKSKYILYS